MAYFKHPRDTAPFVLLREPFSKSAGVKRNWTHRHL